MNNQLSDAKIDELLEELDDYASDRRAIVRAWLPACPKRVRLIDGSGKQYTPCEVVSMTIARDGTVLSYAVLVADGVEIQVPASMYEPVGDESGWMSEISRPK